ncbi:MAG TPA: DUF1456 family protein [Flavobacteriaceae bacterium]|nr:DUF1456 family protein [Flavobacteriaceae bacterium]
MGLSNNDIFKKLRVAHKMTNDDIVEVCALVDFKVTKSELGAIFRREGHPKYMECGDQFLRNFLDGLIIHLRGPMPDKRKNRSKKKFDSPKSKPKFKKRKRFDQQKRSSFKGKKGDK